VARGANSKPRSELAKAHVLGVAAVAGAGDSSQPNEHEDKFTPNEAISPPLNPDYLANLTAIAPYRRSCIAAVVLNTVGQGVELQPREGEEGEGDGDADPAEVLDELDEFARRDTVLGRPSFKQLLAASKWDEQEVGTGVVEVSRNRITGEVDGCYHVQGKRIRRRKDRKGWIMGPRKRSGPDQVIRYYDFGDKVQYDDEGRPTSTLRPGRNWATNEVIVFRLYTSASRDYGLPPDYQLAVDYLGDKQAARANVAYFENSGVPPTVIFVQGKEAEDGEGGIEIEVDARFVQTIANTVRLQGESGQRVAVVPVPPGTTTTAHDLSVLSDRDLGHVQFRSDNRRRALGAWRLSPIFVADIEDAGKYTAEVERAITKEQVFDTEQERWADQLDSTLIHEIAPHLAMRFREIAIKGDEARRESADALADRGKITNIEYREAHGYGPMPEAAAEQPSEEEIAEGKVPKGWNAQLVEKKQVALNPLGAASEEIEKARHADGLAEEIEDLFDRSIDDAVRTVSAMTDDAEIRAVVLEKLDDRVLVRPYSQNGDGE
jgi:capsid portal protein